MKTISSPQVTIPRTTSSCCRVAALAALIATVGVVIIAARPDARVPTPQTTDHPVVLTKLPTPVVTDTEIEIQRRKWIEANADIVREYMRIQAVLEAQAQAAQAETRRHMPPPLETPRIATALPFIARDIFTSK